MSRASIVAMLVAAEVLIAGLALYVIGSHGQWHGVFAHGTHQADFVAKPVAPIAAGSAPHVTIDDRESQVAVGTSSDGMVHVTDLTNVHGFFWGSGSGTIAQLVVSQTADGVAITRPQREHGPHFDFGETDERIQIDLPSNARVEITHCAGAKVTGVDGGVTARSQDGRITLASLKGIIDASSADGSVEATGIRADSVTVRSNDGHITLRDVTTSLLTAQTDDGRIEASALVVAGGVQPRATLHSDNGSVHVHGSFAPGGVYEVSTQDGTVELGLSAGADLTVTASTADGGISVDGDRVESDDGNAMQHTIRLGNGSGSLRASSADGSIHITTNGAV